MDDEQDRKPTGLPFPPQTFDPREEYSVVQRRLPHWSQAGAIAFITWRTWDSMPAKVIDTWLAERDEILKRLGAPELISLREMKGNLAEQDEYRTKEHLAERDEYERALQKLPRHLARAVEQAVTDRWNEHLDALHGECVLRRPELGRIVADSLKRFHHDRYALTDYVVMPNHVHLLAAFVDEAAMLAQCDSWKHYTAREINRLLGRKGRLWQQDGFDHLVRSPEDFDRYRRYIAENPARARLRPGEYVHERLEISAPQ
jgi:type I restriction enzyme R subunit